MKILSITLLVATALGSIGLAGCQTTEDDYYYSDGPRRQTYETWGDEAPVYRSRPQWRETYDRPEPRYVPERHAPPPPRFEPRAEPPRPPMRVEAPVHQPRRDPPPAQGWNRPPPPTPDGQPPHRDHDRRPWVD